MLKQLSWFWGEILITNTDRPESQAGMRFVISELGDYTSWGTIEECRRKLKILEDLRPKVDKLDDYFLRKCTISWIDYYAKSFTNCISKIEKEKAKEPVIEDLSKKLDKIR